MRDGEKQILDLVDLEVDEPNFRASLGLGVERPNDVLLPSKSVVDKRLDDVIRTALDFGRHKRVWASGRCQLRTS